MFTPVALPLGRLRLSTSPTAIGSAAVVNTIGIAEVAALAASAAGVLSRPSRSLDDEPGRSPAPVAGHIGRLPSDTRSPRSGLRRSRFRSGRDGTRPKKAYRYRATCY